jgi:hypothetical protein
MAARKQFIMTAEADPELVKLLDDARKQEVSEEDLHEQRISFAFGNAPADAELITKETVRHSSKNIRLTA